MVSAAARGGVTYRELDLLLAGQVAWENYDAEVKTPWPSIPIMQPSKLELTREANNILVVLNGMTLDRHKFIEAPDFISVEGRYICSAN